MRYFEEYEDTPKKPHKAAVYFKEYPFFGKARFVQLNPTGKWKIEKNILSRYYLYLEHKRRFSSEWIHEFELFEDVPVINHCKNNEDV
jgi:hypothetical protein